MKTLCDISAWRYHRIPPQVHAVLDDWLDEALAPGQWSFRRAAALLGLPGLPIHLLQVSRTDVANSTFQRSRLFSGELPLGSIHECSPYVAVTAPALTLFLFATHLDLVDLIMLMHEACGTFSVYVPTPEERAYLQDAIDRRALVPLEGWEPVLDRDRRLTNLWKRPPLLTLEDLRGFARQMKGAKGCRRFAEALRYVHELAASPFEAQAGMRLGLPRRLGGEGFYNLTFNHPVHLSRDAQRICDQSTAYIDILVHSEDGLRCAGVECQSALMHDTTVRGIADGNRITALQSMGYPMIQLSYDNLVDSGSFASIVRCIQRELGIDPRSKSPDMRRSEIDLCRHLFVDWAALGM